MMSFLEAKEELRRKGITQNDPEALNILTDGVVFYLGLVECIHSGNYTAVVRAAGHEELYMVCPYDLKKSNYYGQ